MSDEQAARPGWYVPPAAAPAPVRPTPEAPPSTWPPSPGHTARTWGGPGPFAPPASLTPAVPAPPQRLASPAARLGSVLLDLVLVVVTLGVGWLVWSVVVWGRATTPGKSLLGQRVVHAATGRDASWGRMAVRQVLVGGVVSWALSTITLGLWFVADALLVFGRGHRRLTDRLAGTQVVLDQR